VNIDPRASLAQSPMSRLQVLAVAITIGLNALDGFDVLSSSFASPGIAAEWHITSTALGVVLSMDLLGMAIGSIILGGVADKLGRRPTMLGCLVLMTIGMFMATTASDIPQLRVWRALTGLGIGGMLASINAIAAEFSNAKRRNISVGLMSIGYPVGAVIGGLIVARLLASHNWRSVFYFGAAITAAFIPLVALWIPESVHWLTRKQPSGALERINRTLARMGHGPITALPQIASAIRRRSVADLFAPALIAVTVLVTTAYFFHVTTFYFMQKWVPKLVVNMGFKVTSAATVLVWANVGGALGGTFVGLLAQRLNLKPLTIASMVLSTVMVVLFGHSRANLQLLALVCAGAGFFTNGAIVGMYAIFAQAFPTHVRASGTGLAIGIGRGGSVLAPIIAGFLFDRGFALPSVATTMALGSLVAACALSLLKFRPEQAVGADERAEPTSGVVLPGASAPS